MDLFRLLRQADSIFRRTLYSVSNNQSAEGGGSEHRSHGGYGWILGILRTSDGLPQKELAERLQIRPQSLTEALVRLEDDGLITRTRSEGDKRQQFVSLTRKGVDYADAVYSQRCEAVEKIFAPLTEEERDELARLLLKIKDHFIESEESGIV